MLFAYFRIQYGVGQKVLTYKRFDEFCRQGFIVFSRVSDIGKHLSKCFLVVDPDELLVLGQMLLVVVIVVDILSQIVVVTFLVYEALCGQTVGAYVTYPDYFGTVTDLKALKQKLEKCRVPLLVDGAHSAYFKFLQGEYAEDYPHPVDCGADVVCTSAHKTLPALTGAAYLHLNESFKDVFPVVKHAFDIFGSSSPSYLIMAGLDAFNGAADKFKEELHNFCKEVSTVKAEIAQMGFKVHRSDPMRIVVTSDGHFTGEDFVKTLRACKCEPECFDKDYVIMMLSPYNSEEDLKRIVKAFGILKEGSDVPKGTVNKGYDCMGNFK